MKARELKSHLQRGLGDALLYLYENRGTDRFDDVILEACTRFTNVNFQSDSGNARYYAQAIRTSSNGKALCGKLMQALADCNREDDIIRMNRILYCFPEDEQLVCFCIDRYLEYFEKALTCNADYNEYATVSNWLFDDFVGLSEECRKIGYRLAFSQLGGTREFLSAQDLTVMHRDDPAFWRECYQLADTEPGRLLLLDSMLEAVRKPCDDPVPLNRETYVNLRETKSPYDYESLARNIMYTVAGVQQRGMDAVVGDMLLHIYGHVRCTDCRRFAWELLLHLGLLSESLWNEFAYDCVQNSFPTLSRPKEPVPPLLQMLSLE